ncbi:GH1 family beta-glucosidase [Actinoplanes derwentensis]|uniref:Beta-glucosidase n=1 Tax=Actinoplanes derwentensis TaxID=113562 RepID=A0A1H1UDG2_9ACTN|nr:GH1 family beta-glucosidase [Actinoplanes derwentensis]GID85274.1 beta-glucosidase [Actinoplanes derwentensis]SDS70468.1 broad-specificity cellobiase [Actinoplanes derwentensis]
MTMSFELPQMPAGFVWGAATAAYQIEGAVAEDGRGESIWDVFCQRPGTVVDGTSGAVACDSYHRWRDDVELLAGLGVDAYRFSIAWPRVVPAGQGAINQAGLDHYDRLVDALCERGIRPFVTLYHWDLPQALEDAGGWRVRDTADRFADYAAVVAGRLGDRVQDWITLNEPYVSSMVGYAEGRHAPGATEGHGALAAAHHLLVGHGRALAVLRAARPEARVGITLNISPAIPATDSAADREAANRMDLMLNRQFTDPVLGCAYPDGFERLYAGVSDLSFRLPGDLELIGAPLDFLGVNYYYRIHAADAPLDQPEPARRSAFDIGVRSAPRDGVPLTDLGWPIEAQGLYDTLTGLAGRYPGLPPIYVTENGIAHFGDDPAVPDPERIRFVAQHLSAAARAVTDAAVDLRGYFYWSLIDNFEWARGYAPRFGLVHVDYPTGVRTPRASYHWLRERLSARTGKAVSNSPGSFLTP